MYVYDTLKGCYNDKLALTLAKVPWKGHGAPFQWEGKTYKVVPQVRANGTTDFNRMFEVIS